MKNGLSGAMDFWRWTQAMASSVMSSVRWYPCSGVFGGSTGVSLRKSCGSHWLVSPPWNPYQYSKPSPVGQRVNGPIGVVSQSGVLCHLPQAAVL